MSEEAEARGAAVSPIAPESEELESLVSEVVRLIALAGSGVGRASTQLSIYASIMYDELIGKVSLASHAAGLASALGEPLSSAADLIDCLGEDGVLSALSWAAITLTGGASLKPINVLQALADCMGWTISLNDLTDEGDERLAAAVLVSFSEAMNKWLEELASTANGE